MWKKLGLIFKPDQSLDWMQSHATTPVPVHLQDNEYRIFFSSRNQRNQNSLGYIDIDINTPNKINSISKNPVLELGELGNFDCDGIYGTSIVNQNGKLILHECRMECRFKRSFYSSIGILKVMILVKASKE